MDALERVMGCSLDEAYELFGGRLGRRRRDRVSVPNRHEPEKNASRPVIETGGERLRNGPFAGTLWKADEGTRTLDLLHGNNLARKPSAQLCLQNELFSVPPGWATPKDRCGSVRVLRTNSERHSAFSTLAPLT
jgi:hypothetical protein